MKVLWVNPTYSASGDLLCAKCGKLMSVGMSARGDTLARCDDPQCETGTFEIGGFQHNPAPSLRREMPAMFSPLRYTWGAANWIVKDGVKQEG